MTLENRIRRRRKNSSSKGWIIGFLILIPALVLGWHMHQINSMDLWKKESIKKRTPENMGLSISANPITNLITFTFRPIQSDNDPFEALGSAIATGLIKMVGPGFIERELNTIAREKYDLYAMFIPYKVKIVVENLNKKEATDIATKQESQISSAQAKQKEQVRRGKSTEAELDKSSQQDEEERRKKETQLYISSKLILENLRVSKGESWGKAVTGVFGTVVNNGSKTLKEVKIRVYFLDAEGKRIGEHDYYPVLVSRFSSSDEYPLRPGYRKDFGYNVEDYAPSGWAKTIEGEIVEIEFTKD